MWQTSITDTTITDTSITDTANRTGNIAIIDIIGITCKEYRVRTFGGVV